MSGLQTIKFNINILLNIQHFQFCGAQSCYIAILRGARRKIWNFPYSCPPPPHPQKWIDAHYHLVLTQCFEVAFTDPLQIMSCVVQEKSLLRGRHISNTEPARPLCELKSAFSPGWRPGVCSITAGSAAIFRDRPAFAGHRNLFLIQRFSNGRISDLRNMTCTNFRCPIYARSGRRRTPGRTSGGARPSVETRKAPAPISTGLRTTPVSLLTGAVRFLITSFRRAPPEPRPKCDRVHFRQKYARVPGEFEIRRRSGDLRFRPEIVGYVT